MNADSMAITLNEMFVTVDCGAEALASLTCLVFSFHALVDKFCLICYYYSFLYNFVIIH